MNKKLLFLLPLIGAMSLAGCGDKNKDEKPSEEPVHEHVDANHDHKCDSCGETISSHVDANNDHKCDECGATVSEHVDANHDHVCDTCGASISSHVDADGDLKCDYCGADLDIVKVELDTSGAKLVFAFGEEFTSEGLKVVATSSTGSKKNLEFTAVAPDMSTGGEKTVVVSYGTGENDKLEYKITVTYWTSEDLAVFEEGSFTSYAPLPYLPDIGMHAVAEYKGEGEEKEFASWKIVADQATEEDLIEYRSALKAYNHVVPIDIGDEEETDVTFKLQEVSLNNVEGYHGLSEVSVFTLVPTYDEVETEVNEDTGEEEEAIYKNRCFTLDEYFILGLNSEGSLVLESRMVNAVLDGMFFGDGYAEGEYGFKAEYNSYIDNLGKIILYYYSEYSSFFFAYPPLEGAEWSFVPMSLFSLRPLDESLDEYDLAWYIALPNATSDDFDAFITTLTNVYHYEAVEHEATEEEEAYTSYVLETKYVGTIEYVPTFSAAVEPDPEDPEDEGKPSAILFEFYYTAPESYTTHLSPFADYVISIFEGSIESVDNVESLTTPSFFTQHGNDVYSFEMEGLVATAEQEAAHVYSEMLTADYLASFLVESLGFSVVSEASETHYASTSGNVYYAYTLLSNPTYGYNIEIDVSEPDADGISVVELYVSDYISPERLVEMVFGSAVEPDEHGIYSYGFGDPAASVEGGMELILGLVDGFQTYGITIDGVEMISETQMIVSGTMNFEEYAFTLVASVSKGVGYYLQLDFSKIDSLEETARYISDLFNGSNIRGLDYASDGVGGFDIISIIEGGEEAILDSDVEDIISAYSLYLAMVGLTAGEVEKTESGYAVTCYSSSFDVSVSASLDSESNVVSVLLNVHEHEVTITEGFPNEEIASFFGEIAVELAPYSSSEESVQFVSDTSPLANGGYIVKVVGSTTEEMAAYASAMRDLGWVLAQDELGDYEGKFGETDASVYIADYTDPQYLSEGEAPYILVYFSVKSVLTEFPVDVIEGFFEDSGIEIVIPEFEGSEEVTFDVDDSYAGWGYLSVYANNATREEMLAYVAAVGALDGWTATEDKNGDYELKHESGAVIYVYDYTNPEDLEEDEDPYISFGIYVEVAEEIEAE